MKKNARVLTLLLSATVLLLLFGYQKGLLEKQADPLPGKTSSGTMSVPDVYVAGSEAGQAVYWKNGQVFPLPGGFQANGIVVVGTDVYVCGYGTDPTTFNLVAQYWKNGVLTNLSDGSNLVIATGIAVSGTDVYVSGRVGFFSNTGVYWKNGVEYSLGAGEPNGIFVDTNGDVYIANGEYGNPSYWKNGTLISLPGSSNAYVRSIAVSGSDVYVVGANSAGPSETALYWKNGASQWIMTSFNTNAMAVAVNSNGQPVISGVTGQNVGNMQIAYWDAIQDLHVVSPTGRFVAASTGIAVDPTTDDIYVCGSEYNSPSTPPAIAKYWTISNTGSISAPVSLSNGSSNATALAIALGW